MSEVYKKLVLPQTILCISYTNKDRHNDSQQTASSLNQKAVETPYSRFF